MPNNFSLNKVPLLFFLVAFLTHSSQTLNTNNNTSANPNADKCITKLSPGYQKVKKNAAQVMNMVNSLKHDTCLNKKFSIVFYVVLDSLTPPTWGGINQGNLNAAVDSLNNKFKRICVSFQSCSTVVIHNYVFNQWDPNLTEGQVTSNWYTTQTINIYLVANVTGTANSAGYTYMPGSPGNTDIIVMRKNALNTKVLYHLIGHFFGLPDTHGEIGSPIAPAPPFPPPPPFSYEYVDRVNCGLTQNGDGFCDTEADPYPASYNNLTVPCGYTYGPVDGMGKYYTPPVDNYMSEYLLSCRCKYTQEQMNFMASIILTQKLYLH